MTIVKKIKKRKRWSSANILRDEFIVSSNPDPPHRKLGNKRRAKEKEKQKMVEDKTRQPQKNIKKFKRNIFTCGFFLLLFSSCSPGSSSFLKSARLMSSASRPLRSNIFASFASPSSFWRNFVIRSETNLIVNDIIVLFRND